MAEESSSPFFSFVYGPTASGKSHWALDQCAYLSRQGLRAAIVNGDSLQVYEDLVIGSASPSVDDKKSVPHYLFNYKSAGTELTIGDYYRDFFSILPELTLKFDRIFVVGGSGFYLQSIFFGLFEVGASNLELRSKIESDLKDPELEKKYYQELLQFDPETAHKIHPNDHYRLARFLEIIRTTGQTVSGLHRKHKEAGVQFSYPFELIMIDKNREELEKSVQKRTLNMLQEGLVDEVKLVLSRGFSDWSALQSVGYREVCAVLSSDEHSLNESINVELLAEEISRSTMRLIKKQRTWARRWQMDPRLIGKIKNL